MHRYPELVQTLSDLQNSIDDGENEDPDRIDCSVIGDDSNGVTEFNIDHERCAGVVLSENETRQVPMRENRD